MSKRTIGLLSGAGLLVSGVALVALLGGGSSVNASAHHSSVRGGALLAQEQAAGVGAKAGTKAGNKVDGKGVQLVAATTKPSTKASPRPVPKATRPVVVKPVRTLTLAFPTLPAKVGTNVTGSIQVMDVAGTTITPVANAAVALQQKRGASWVSLSDGVTDDTGMFPVAFQSTVNLTWRAVLTPDTGAKKYSSTVNTIASSLVTWAARPDMDVVHGTASSYSFRVNSANAATGHLEIANSTTPTKWVALKNITVPGSDVVTQAEKFPTAGTWLLRGASAATPTNGAGYTTVLTINVG